MNAIKLDGKKLSIKIREQILSQTEQLKTQGIVPGLAVILVGDDKASQIYVRNKEKACSECGFYSEKHILPATATEKELINLIYELNKNKKISGILCQLPLPKQINQDAIISAIDPKKDVDAFSVSNVGKIMIGNYDFLPCTPAGVMELLNEYNINPEGKNCVVVGRSNIVGKPMSMLLLHKNGTVTICHSKTKNLKEICQNADILIAAVGKADFITSDMIKNGAVIIDVGMNRDENGKLCGDVAQDAEQKASYITPVPGGVGPMTITMLMKNTIKAAKLQNGIL